MSDPTPNPFASPAVISTKSAPDHDPNVTIAEFEWGKSTGKWLLVCMFSAAPSFLWAFMLPADVFVRCSAMIAGILSFVGLFVFLESRTWIRHTLLDPTLRRAVRTGFVSRIILTAVFPVSMLLDMWCGFVSISIVEGVFGNEAIYEGRAIGTYDSVGMFFWFYITTIVQGVVLNVVLASYSLLVYGGLLFFGRGKKHQLAGGGS